nr:Cas9 endonuclease PAM-interacting domain-containing protein [Eubacterium sp.]
MNKNNIRYTRYAYEKKGGFWDQTISKKGRAQVQLSNALSDMEKYGGRTKVSAAYFACVEHGPEKKREVSLYAVNLYDKNKYEEEPLEYLIENYSLINPVIKVKRVKIQSCISFDNMRCHLGGKESGGSTIVYRPAVQLVLGYQNERYVRNVIRCADGDLHLQSENDPKNKVTAEQNCQLYDLLLDKMSNNIYGVLFSDLAEKLSSEKDNFEKLELVDQCKTLKNILIILKNNASKGDLKSIGIKSNGAIRLNNHISKIKDIESIKLINQSVTGLYETEVELVGKE